MSSSDPARRQAAIAVAVRPDLWPSAARAARRHLPSRWWRGPGALRSAEPWLRFRLETAYGTERGTPPAGDLVTWLRWLRTWPRVRR
ncbi:hypothetical protein [Iamia sp.]|uniref:hypothetical protein n=1 Tax=Iamia sp. TaxID=2722710 RepID=UPI002B9A0829|nr:hypothetical protein [Iamia sp.]HXH58192.1 hypothetical protein [Iamia sp.]